MAILGSQPNAGHDLDAVDLSRPWLYTIAGVAAMIMLAILLIGGMGIISSISQYH